MTKYGLIFLYLFSCNALCMEESNGRQYLLEALEYTKHYLATRSLYEKEEGDTKIFVGKNYTKVKYISFYKTVNKNRYEVEEQIYDYNTGNLIYKKIRIFSKNFDVVLYVIFLDNKDNIVSFGKIFPIKKIIQKPNIITFISETHYFDKNGKGKYLYRRNTVVDYSKSSANYYDDEITVEGKVISHTEGNAHYEEYEDDEKLLH